MNFSETAYFSWKGVVMILPLLGLGLILLAGLIFLTVGIVNRRPWQVVLSVLIPLVCMSGVGFVIYQSFNVETVTAANVAPGEVPFLRLPSTATNIGYWQDGNSWIAECNVPEHELAKILPNISLSEISSPTWVQPKIYGDRQLVPYREQHSQPKFEVKDGLFYHTEQSNGGGYDVVYDRAQSRLYFEYIGR